MFYILVEFVNQTVRVFGYQTDASEMAIEQIGKDATLSFKLWLYNKKSEPEFIGQLTKRIKPQVDDGLPEYDRFDCWKK